MSAAWRSTGAWAFTASNVQTPTTLSPGAPSGVAVGDFLLLVCESKSNTATVATPAGWTPVTGSPVRSGTAAGGTIYLFVRIADGTANDTPSPIWSGLATGTSGDASGAGILCYTGLSITLDGTLQSSDLAGQTNTSVIPAFTTGTNNSMVIGVAMKLLESSAQTSTVATFTERADNQTTSGTGHTIEVCEKLQASAGGTGTATVTWSATTSARALTLSVGFKQAANTYSHTMTGGASFGGTATIVSKPKVVVSGGMTSSGSATKVAKAAVVATGGMTSGGAGTIVDKPSITMTGGLTSGGTAAQNFSAGKITPTRQIKFTIDHTQVGGSDLTDLAVFVKGTFPELKTVANGGYINNTTPFLPADFVFAPTMNGASPYDFKIVGWDGGTGDISAWLRVPSVSASVDTVFYAAYGDPLVTISKGDNPAAFNAFSAVYRMDGGSGVDTSPNAFHGTVTGATQTTGQLDDALAFTQSTTRLETTTNAALAITSDGTFSAWIYPTDWGLTNATVFKKNGNYILRGELTVLVAYYWDGTSLLTASCALPSINTWHKVDVVIASNAISEIRVDNVPQTLTPANLGSFAQSTSAMLTIGNKPSPTNTLEAFIGSIDHATIVSGVARTDGWLTAEWNNQKTSSTFWSAATPGPISATYSHTMTGGMTSGGSATKVAKAAIVASGGVTTGGTATVAYRTNRIVTPSGGMSSSGAASLVSKVVKIASGGLVTAGAALVLMTAHVNASGGVTTSGHAATTAKSVITGSGGATFAGIATIAVHRIFAYLATGGLTSAGTAPITNRARLIGSGGLTSSGVAVLRSTVHLVGLGGVTSGGSAHVQRSLVLATSGGLTTSGTSASDTRRVISGSGGLTTAGTAITYRSYASASSGGLISSGIALIRLTNHITGLGGLTSSGAAHINQHSVLVASGGSVFGGAADTANNAGFNIFRYTMDGGATLNGFALITNRSRIAASGGLTSSGGATIHRAVIIHATGGLISAGTASSQTLRQMVASGGAVFGGSASTSQSGFTVFQPSVDGGITFSGSAAIRSRDVIRMSGGLVTNGAATSHQIFRARVSGGLSASGIATIQRMINASMSGGLITGGHAATRRQIRLTTSGGLTTAGVAFARKVYTGFVSGGLQTSGAALIARQIVIQSTAHLISGGHASVSFSALTGATILFRRTLNRLRDGTRFFDI